MSYQVFISASAKDSELAQDLSYRLQEAGAKVVAGEKPALEGTRISLDPHLMKADEVVVLLTDHSVNSQWVLLEMGAAWGQHKRLTPVIVGLEDRELPHVVKSMSYVKYGDLRKYISALEDRLREQSHAPRMKPKAGPKKKKTGAGASERRRLAAAGNA